MAVHLLAALCAAAGWWSPWGMLRPPFDLLMQGVRPWPGRLLVNHAHWAQAATVVLCLALVTGSIGLQCRQEWARRLVLVLLALLVAGQLAGLWLQHELVTMLVETTLRRFALPPPVADLFDGIAIATQVLGVLLGLTTAAIGLWAMRRLVSAGVRQEFA